LFFGRNQPPTELSDDVDISSFLQFINHLVNQLAAHRFLKIACHLERRTKISGAYSLLKAIEMELQSYLSAVNGRLVGLAGFVCYVYDVV
jgi:HAUS augmin-like complex subunit 3